MAVASFNANYPLWPSFDLDDDDSRNPRAVIQRWNRYRRDYGHESATNKFPVPVTPFPLLKLPIEIRRLIYTFIIERRWPLNQMRPDGSGWHWTAPIDLRLAVTNKQIFKEVMTTFFEVNTLQFEIHPRSDIPSCLPVLFDPKALSAQYWPLGSIKRVELVISLFRTEHTNFVRTELEKFCRVLRSCDLKRLQITAYCPTMSFVEGLHESFDQALQCVEGIRGVQEMIFTEDVDAYFGERPGYAMLRVLGTNAYKSRLCGLVTQPKNIK